jgi:hypothetical protein
MTLHTRNLRDSSIKLVDGTTPTALELLIELDGGDLAFTETNNVTTIKNRGRISHRRIGDEEEMEVSFSAKFVQWSYSEGAATGISPMDALKKRGGAAAWVSTDEACAPFAVDLHFIIADPCNAGMYETLVFPKFTVTSMAFSEGDDSDMVRITGRSLATAPTRTYA